MRLFAFHFTLISLGKAWIHLFSSKQMTDIHHPVYGCGGTITSWFNPHLLLYASTQTELYIVNNIFILSWEMKRKASLKFLHSTVKISCLGFSYRTKTAFKKSYIQQYVFQAKQKMNPKYK